MGIIGMMPEILDAMAVDENIKRKDVSLAEFEIYQDNLRPYVMRYLKGLYSQETLDNMPVIASINLASRIVNAEASIYKNAPEREFYGITEEQEKVLRQIYADLDLDKKLLKSNRYFKLQGQNHIEITLQNGKLGARILLNHHLDAIPNNLNPEKADGYLVSGFDKSLTTLRDQPGDGLNQKIAESDDYKSNQRIAVWTNEENFVVNGKGQLVSDPEKIKNDLGILPFVEISPDKDFEYWVRRGQAVTDFTIQFNGALSDLGHIVRMQGFAQAWMTGPANLLPKNVQIGPSFVLVLPQDPNNPVQSNFGFANPSPDLAGSISYVEMLLSNFLTAKGLDPKLVSGKSEGQHFSSGIERLLSMISEFDASLSDLAIYEKAEQEIFEIVKKYIEVYSGTEGFKYKISKLPDDATLKVQFKKPQMIQSEGEKIETISKKLELGLIDKVEAIAEFYEIDETEAQERFDESFEREIELRAKRQKMMEQMQPQGQPKTEPVETEV